MAMYQEFDKMISNSCFEEIGFQIQVSGVQLPLVNDAMLMETTIGCLLSGSTRFPAQAPQVSFATTA